MEEDVEGGSATSGVTFVGQLGSYRYLEYGRDNRRGAHLGRCDAQAHRREDADTPAFFTPPLKGARRNMSITR